MKFDVEKFTKKEDFSLWKVKMEPLMVHQSLDAALMGDKFFAVNFDAKEKAKIMGRVRSALILSLGDQALRKVVKLKTAKEIWDRLEEMYNSKTTTNKLHLRHKLFAFKITTDKHISDYFSDNDKALVHLGLCLNLMRTLLMQ